MSIKLFNYLISFRWHTVREIAAYRRRANEENPAKATTAPDRQQGCASASPSAYRQASRLATTLRKRRSASAQGCFQELFAIRKRKKEGGDDGEARARP
ncbi:MAG: hypothetical protein ACLUCU_03510 [Slackia sp.]